MADVVLLDTHAILWWQADSGRLSARAAREIARADTVLVSPISCWEIGILLEKGRIALDRDVQHWVRDLLAQDSVTAAQLTPEAATAAARLRRDGFHGDPADQLLYATSAAHAAAFVTKDETIHAFARGRRDVTAIW